MVSGFLLLSSCSSIILSAEAPLFSMSSPLTLPPGLWWASHFNEEHDTGLQKHFPGGLLKDWLRELGLGLLQFLLYED